MQAKAERPTIGSARYCAVTLRHEDPDGWFNTGHALQMPDPHCWISMQGAREVAKWAGWVDPATHAEKVAEAASLRAQLDRAVEEIAALRKAQDAIDTLKGGGFAEVKRAGRPRDRTLAETVARELQEAA